jgi:hypothetical protein
MFWWGKTDAWQMQGADCKALKPRGLHGKRLAERYGITVTGTM